MTEKQEEVNSESQREEGKEGHRKEVEKEHLNLAGEKIFSVGPLDGDVM